MRRVKNIDGSEFVKVLSEACKSSFRRRLHSSCMAAHINVLNNLNTPKSCVPLK